MGIIDYGSQTISYNYNEVGKSENFNRINFKLIEKGIYEGGLLTRVDDTHVSLSPLVSYIEDTTTGLGIRLKTSDTFNIEVSSTIPYIIIKYTWGNLANNYADIVASTFANIESDDIIIGRCVFSGTVLDTSFDYIRRHTAILADDISIKNELKVVSNEPYDNKVYVNGGSVVTSSGLITVAGGASAVITDTVDGRIDLVIIDENGNIVIEEGTDAVTPIANNHFSRVVIAEIHRGALATYITGKDIVLVDYKNARPATLSTDGTFASNSDLLIPTEKAVKTYSDTHANSDGSSHTFINQDVTTTTIPKFEGLDLTGTTDADRLIGFAFDATLKWDESEDKFIFSKKVLSSFNGYYFGGLLNQTAIFSALTSFIPLSGDKILVSGAASTGVEQYVFTYIYRDSTTTMRLYYIDITSSATENYLAITSTGGDMAIGGGFSW